jgi:hypothetical protein
MPIRGWPEADHLLVKAYQFINSQNPRYAQAFVDEHRGMPDLQRILDDLGGWNPGVLPYIQDLPLRLRGLMLEPELKKSSPFWQELEV